MATSEDFKKATDQVTKLSRKPGNDILLRLYSLFKQSTEGDVKGSRPGMIDFKGRAKWDAWNSLKGTSTDKAQIMYVDLVKDLIAKDKS